MKISTKTICDELEIVNIYVSKSYSIIVDVFQVLEEFKSFARNTNVHHFDLEGYGVHENKRKSIKPAIKNILQLIKDNPG